jgi:hypothetical protein
LCPANRDRAGDASWNSARERLGGDNPPPVDPKSCRPYLKKHAEHLSQVNIQLLRDEQLRAESEMINAQFGPGLERELTAIKSVTTPQRASY